MMNKSYVQSRLHFFCIFTPYILENPVGERRSLVNAKERRADPSTPSPVFARLDPFADSFLSRSPNPKREPVRRLEGLQTNRPPSLLSSSYPNYTRKNNPFGFSLVGFSFMGRRGLSSLLQESLSLILSLATSFSALLYVTSPLDNFGCYSREQ